MRFSVIVIAAISLLTSCKGKKDGNQFEVKGTIANNTARMIYLEEVPMIPQNGVIRDSAELGKDGKFKLKTCIRLQRSLMMCHPLTWMPVSVKRTASLWNLTK